MNTLKKTSEIWLESFSIRYDICISMGFTDLKIIKTICNTRYNELPLDLKKALNNIDIISIHGNSPNIHYHTR